MGFRCRRGRHPRPALAGPYNPNSSIVMRKDFIRVQKNLQGSKRMARHGLQLWLILLLGTWLGACDTPSSKSMPSLPMPESGPSRDSQQEDPDQPPNEQAEQHPQDSPRQPQESIDPEARTSDAQAPVRTEDEGVAVLDQQLEEALGRYDEQIHEEFEKAQAERRTHGQAPAGAGQEAGSGRESARAANPATQAGKTSEAKAQTGTRSSSAEAGDPDDDSKEDAEEHKNRGTHSAPPPADIPSGDDDDVVARQLREAAQKERDPVLRDKLWDEYRKYKRQQAGTNPLPSAEGE